MQSVGAKLDEVHFQEHMQRHPRGLLFRKRDQEQKKVEEGKAWGQAVVQGGVRAPAREGAIRSKARRDSEKSTWATSAELGHQ
jgi:hypothetical protein